MQTISVDQNAISASGEQLATVHQRCVKVVVSAAWTNTGVVSISCDSGVTYPIQLGAGQAIPLDVDDPAVLFLKGSASSGCLAGSVIFL